MRPEVNKQVSIDKNAAPKIFIVVGIKVYLFFFFVLNQNEFLNTNVKAPPFHGMC